MRIGVLSFAHLHAASYVRVLARTLGVELLTSDPGHGRRPPGKSGGAALAAELGVRHVDSYAEVLRWRPDGVLVCAENALHRPLVELAAAAGAHVLCEKPLATTLPDARAMVDACAAAGVHLMVAHPVRFLPAFAALEAAYRSGSLGEVLAVTGTNNGRLPVGDRRWFVDPELAGGGAVMDHTVHVVDLLDRLFDGSPVRSVYATTNRLLHADEVPVETGGLLSLTYANGVIATVDCSWSRPASSPTWGGLTLQLVGTAGVADLDAFADRVEGHSEVRGTGLWLPSGPDTDELMLTEFLTAVSGGRSPQPDGASGCRSLAVALAGYRSMASGQPVELVPDRG